MRRVPSTGINLFQLIYILIREYTEKTGLEPLNLSLGNPDTVPIEAIRRLKARYAQDPGFDYHTYAEDRNLRSFVEGMVELHGRIRHREHEHLAAVPIPGIKTASALMGLACGLHLPDRKRRDTFTVVTTAPAYDVAGTWGESYLGARRVVWPLLSEDGMQPRLSRLKAQLKRAKIARPDLLFIVRPGNPASVAASTAQWRELIEFCMEKKTRLVSDAAYCGLAGDDHAPLASVAKEYKELEWAELYSVSKSFSDPGARLGAMVGSRDFVQDFIMIKGNTESGPNPGVLAAYGDFLADKTAARAALSDLSSRYRRRLDYLIPKLAGAGLLPACATDAGFFTLWKTPRRAFGLELAKKAGKVPLHEYFNRLVIGETGIVGVHFRGPGPKGEALIRYAVCADVLSPAFQGRFEEQLGRLKPEYN